MIMTDYAEPMRWKNQFFKLENWHETAPDSYLFRVNCLPDHPVYTGHFPEVPVTPGVLQMMLVKDCLEQMTGQLLRLKECRECKFLALHMPAKEVELSVQLELLEQADQNYRIAASVRGENQVYTKMKGIFDIVSEVDGFTKKL